MSDEQPPRDMTAVSPSPPRHRGRRIGLVAGAVVILGVVIAFAVLRNGHGYPDSLLGFERMHTADAQGLEDQARKATSGDSTVHAAAYGTGDTIEVAIARYHNLPLPAEPDGVLRFEADQLASEAGGWVDMEHVVPLSSDGVEYRCAPYAGKLFPSASEYSKGQLCVWAEKADVGLVFVLATQDGATAASQTAEIHATLS